ncbi:MAG: TIR domain-containing protein, partial [Opitutus sp.]|nr:TIR domain-containing protein [Opitutus sp.]
MSVERSALNVERSAPRGAIFLSYASQDAEAARRICEALRAAGIEVWFDQSELRGGDAWVGKIRGQIKECALFLPVISANTEARPEGYFRLEWKLADRRTDLMGKSKPFIVPISIDGTRDRGADVPDSFLAVQWTHLPGGETSAAFCERVKSLLVGPMELGRSVGSAAAAKEARSAERDEGVASPVQAKTGRRVPAAAWTAAIVVALAAVVWLVQRRNEIAVPANAGARVRPPVAEKTVAPAPETIPSAAAAQPPLDFASAKSIAVLAFKTSGGDKESEGFSEGISDELLNLLATVPGLRVAARASAFYFKDKNATTQEMGRQRNVAYLVDGTVQSVGSTARVTARLSRADTGDLVWSRKFEGELKNIFKLQDDIAGGIAENLKLKLVGAPRAVKEVNPEAYRLLLEGRYFWNLRSTVGFAQAEAAILKAIALGPEFAQAHAALADVIVMRASYALQDGRMDQIAPVDLARARAEAQNAIDLDPAIPDAYAALAYVFFLELRFAEAEQQFQKALALNPNFGAAHAWHATLLLSQGHLERGLLEIEKAAVLDPLWARTVSTYAETQVYARRLEDALKISDRARALHPDFVPNLGHQARLLFALGRKPEAIETARLVRQHRERTPRRDADSLSIWVLCQAGLRDEAAAHADEYLKTLPETSQQRGFVLGALGRFDEALPYLEQTPPVVWRRLFWDPMWDQ